MKIPKLKFTYWVIIFCFIALVYFSIYPTGQGKYVDQGILYPGFFIFMLLFFEWGWELMKVQSPQFVGDPIHGSTDGYWHEVGEWAIIVKDAIDAWGFHIEYGGTGTVVLPKFLLRKYGRNLATPVFFMPIKKTELPSVVYEYVERNPNKFKRPFYFGIMTQEQLKAASDIGQIIPGEEERLMTNEDLLQMVLEANELNAQYKDLARGRFKHIEDIAAAASRISHKMTRKSIWERLRWPGSGGEKKE